RSVNASAGFGLGNALYAMHAGFVLQSGINFVAFDQRNGLLDAADSRFGGVENFHLPALTLGVARVHAQNISSEQRCFITAGAGANFQSHVLFIVRRSEEHTSELQSREK